MKKVLSEKLPMITEDMINRTKHIEFDVEVSVINKQGMINAETNLYDPKRNLLFSIPDVRKWNAVEIYDQPIHRNIDLYFKQFYSMSYMQFLMIRMKS